MLDAAPRWTNFPNRVPVLVNAQEGISNAERLESVENDFRRTRAHEIVGRMSRYPTATQRSRALTGMFRELLAKPGYVFVGGRPVRIACIAVENQRPGFQCFLEAFLAECNCLAVIVRTYDFKIHRT
jgi:hypothetical protein